MRPDAVKSVEQIYESLSVPFSSGCALRHDDPILRPPANILSVPFSSGCALRLLRSREPEALREALSVPFSSGCALRPWRAGASAGADPSSFSSLLIGMCFATDLRTAILWSRLGISLSVPFSSGCALRPTERISIHNRSESFSSLLIGMCFATKSTRNLGRRWYENFQFPSHRDVLCDSNLSPNSSSAHEDFQFPSHRDVLCDSIKACREAGDYPGFQFPSHRDVLCDL